MTALSPSARYVSLSPSAGTTVLSWDFKVGRDDGLEVVRIRADVRETLALGDDYTFPGGLGDATGGTLTLVAPSLAGDVYQLIGATPEDRLSDFVASQGFGSSKMNADLDQLTYIAQEHRRDLRRSVKLPYGADELQPIETAEEGHALGWKDGQLVNLPVTPGAIEAAIEQAQGILDDTSDLKDATAAIRDDAAAIRDDAAAQTTAAVTAAQAAQELSEAYAENGEDIEVEPGKFSAKNYATKASAAEAAAVLARDAALAVGRLYPDVATGVGAVSDGQYFYVAGTGDVFASLYRRNGSDGDFQNLQIASKTVWDAMRLRFEKRQYFGRPIDAELVTGSAIGDATFVHAGDPFPAGYLRRYTYKGRAVGQAYVSVWSVSGTTVTMQAEVQFTTAIGDHSLDLEVPVQAGWVGGIYAFDSVGLIEVEATDSDGGGLLNNASGHNTTNFSDATFARGNRIQHRYEIASQSVTEDRVAQIEDDADSVVELLSTSQIIGRPVSQALTTGSPISNATIVHKAAPITATGILWRYDYYGLVAKKTAYLSLWSVSGDTVTLQSEIAFQTKTGDQSIYPRVTALQGWVAGLCAYDGAGLIAATVATGDSGGYLDSSGHVRDSFTDSSLQTGVQIQHRFWIRSQSVTETRVAAIETTANTALAIGTSLADAVISAIGTGDARETLGASSPALTGSPASNATYVLSDVFTGAGARTVDAYIDSWTAALNAAGTNRPFGVWRHDLDSGETVAVRVALVSWDGANVVDFVEGTDWPQDFLRIDPGQYHGFDVGNRIDYVSPRTNPGYWAGPAGSTSFTQLSNPKTVELQSRVTVRYRSINVAASSPVNKPTTFAVFHGESQSNLLATATEYGDAPEEGIAYKWNSSAGTLDPLQDPTGNLGTPKGSPYPAFASRYFQLTGEGVIIVNMAKGGSGLVEGTGGAFGNWSPTGSLRQGAIDALNACIAYLEAHGYAYRLAGVIGVAMETDAIALGNGEITVDQYKDALAAHRTWLEEQTGMGPKMPWILTELGVRSSGDTAAWQAIRAAQRQFCRDSANTWLGWIGARNLEARDVAEGDGTYMEADGLHWAKKAQSEHGWANAAVAAVRCAGVC